MISKYSVDVQKVEKSGQVVYEVRTIFVFHNRTYVFLLARTGSMPIARQMWRWFKNYLSKGTLPVCFIAMSESKHQRKVNYVMHHVQDKKILCVSPSAITVRMWMIANGFRQEADNK